MVLRDPSSLRSVGMTASRFAFALLLHCLVLCGQTHRSAPTAGVFTPPSPRFACATSSMNRGGLESLCFTFHLPPFTFHLLVSAPTISSYLSYRPHGRYLVMVLRDPSSLRSVGMTASRFAFALLLYCRCLLGRHTGLPLQSWRYRSYLRFYLTKILLPSMIYKPLLGFSIFLPCKSFSTLTTPTCRIPHGITFSDAACD